MRKTSSRLAPALELFARVDLLLVRGRNLDVITQVERVAGPRLDADVARTAHAYLIVELAERVTEEHHPVEGIFELTVLALEDLAQEEQPRRASAYYVAQALQLLGYAPQLQICASCERLLPPAPAAFSAAAGGLLCAGCLTPGMMAVSVAAIKVLRLMAQGELPLYRRLKLEGPLLAEVEGVLEGQLEHHLDRRLKSLAFLRQMRSPV